MSFVSADYLLSETDETQCLPIYGRSNELSHCSKRYQTTNVAWFKSLESAISYRMIKNTKKHMQSIAEGYLFMQYVYQ